MPGPHDLARSWEAKGVDAIAVEHALANLTRQPSPATGEAPLHPIPRARVMNLIVRAGQAEDLGDALSEVSHLANCHPLRAIVVRGGTGAPAEGLDALAALECVPHTGTPSTVCLEEIQLTMSDAALAHPSSAVAPLLIPDLPVVLWWLGNLPRPDDTLLELSDSLIVDSDALGISDLPDLEQLVGALGSQIDIRDLAWTALEPIRDILAELFDPPAARPYQFGITTVQVTFADAPAQARLLVGWLASRLSWSARATEASAGRTAERVTFNSTSGPVEATIGAIAAPPSSSGCRAVRIEISARHAGHTATFTIARQPDHSFRATRSAIPNLPSVSHPVALTRPPLIAVLSDLLAFPKDDEGYCGALDLASRLITAP